MIELTDTHCHIHEAQAGLAGDDATQDKWRLGRAPAPDTMIAEAVAAGVTRLVCVGCTLEDSERAVDFAGPRAGVWASVGIHPHEAKRYAGNTEAWQRFAALAARPKVVAVGECGLDYFYNHSPRAAQIAALRRQIELALEADLPLIFHVREAFRDFWPVFDEYTGLRGVIHSFSADRQTLGAALARGLYIGLNGIVTFMKDPAQLAAARAVPLERLLLETDAPYLTPVPYRGTVCMPRHARVTAGFLSELYNLPLATIAQASTQNAQALFSFQ